MCVRVCYRFPEGGTGRMILVIEAIGDDGTITRFSKDVVFPGSMLFTFLLYIICYMLYILFMFVLVRWLVMTSTMVRFFKDVKYDIILNFSKFYFNCMLYIIFLCFHLHSTTENYCFISLLVWFC